MAKNVFSLVIQATDRAGAVFDDINRKLDETADKAEESSKQTESSSEKGATAFSKRMAVITGAVMGVVSQVTQRAVTAVTNSIGSAIRRVDTLDNAERVFQNIGFGAEDVTSAMSDLVDGITGLPTPLDQAVTSLQDLASANGDIRGAERIYQALNNSVLAFGGQTGSTEAAVRAMSRALNSGRLQGQEFNTLMDNMGPVINKIAEEMNMTTGELQSGLSDGTISVEKFNERLLQLNDEGSGSFVSLEQQARDATAGIGTGMANAQNAITRGVEDIIEAIGSDNISAAITKIGETFEKVLSFIAELIPPTVEKIKELVDFVVEHQDIFLPMAAGVTAVILALAAWKTYNAIANTVSELSAIASTAKLGAGAVQQLELKTKLASKVQAAFNLVMSANPVAVIVLAVIALVAALVYFFTQTETGKQIVEDFGKVIGDVWDSIVEGIKGVGEWFVNLWDGIVEVFNSIIDFIKQWGLTILAVIFWPFALAIGLIITFKDDILNILKAIWDGIVAVFTPIVDFFAGIFKNAWDGIVAIWESVTGWFGDIWGGITAVFGGVGNWFRDRFKEAWEGIKSVFSSFTGFFRGLWDSVVDIFKKVGTAIGDAIGDSVKGAVNNVLGFAEGTINKFIGAINSAIGVINAIPGVNIPEVPRLNLPRLASGTAFSEAGMHLVGENGPELVNLPRGSRVTPATQTRRVINENNNRNVEVNMTVNKVSNEVDVQELGYKMGKAVLAG